MINKKNSKQHIYKTILAALIILLTITPVAARDTPVANQYIDVIVPEVIGITVNPIKTTLTLVSQNDMIGVYQSDYSSVKNTGNVNINIGIQLNDDFKLGSTKLNFNRAYIILNENWFTLNKDTQTIFKYGLTPGSTTTPLFTIQDVPLITPQGTYSTTATYTAIPTQ